MRDRTFGLTSILLCICGVSYAQTSTTAKVEADLTTLEKQSWEAWQKRDGKFFAGFLSDDHVEVGQSGIAGKPAIVDFVGSPICKVNSYKVDQFKIVILEPNVALLTYHAEQDTTCGSVKVPSPVWASSLYVRRNGKWQNALYQQTPIAK